jgi:hypothetical protein
VPSTKSPAQFKLGPSPQENCSRLKIVKLMSIIIKTLKFSRKTNMTHLSKKEITTSIQEVFKCSWNQMKHMIKEYLVM